MDTFSHLEYMKLALQLAARGRNSVSPNPMVGCVIVKDQRILGQGYHVRAGEGHAEVNALQDAGSDAAGATAYVTLEPCCHFGRTPPCTGALIKAGIKKVFIACKDPNPLVAGQGIAELQAHGIEVATGLAESDARLQNEIFFKYITAGRPFVIAKWAMSLDGKTITTPGDSRKISGAKSSLHTHEIRQQVDAILVGSTTAIADDPELTARSQSHIITRQPTRIILASKGLLPAHLKIINGSLPGKTWIATTAPVNRAWHDAMTAQQVEVIMLPRDEKGQVCLHSLLAELGKRQITSVLVEGGMTVHESFFRENLVDKILVYVAPVFIGSLAKKITLENVEISQLDRDVIFSARNEDVSHV
jgi:diaminohydroxyphosphoribosylaminopyrimidine deaminase/5-amino-6-(5-phosphoribosylamino)uracil reductase